MSGSRPIFLIEDETDDAALTQRGLNTHLANPIVILRDGAQALEYLFEGIGRELPLVTLLDFGLPKVGGLEVLRRVRADVRTRLLPVVILTASENERDMVECHCLGCNSYVRKPANSAEFADVARQLGPYWLLLNEPPSGR